MWSLYGNRKFVVYSSLKRGLIWVYILLCPDITHFFTYLCGDEVSVCACVGRFLRDVV